MVKIIAERWCHTEGCSKPYYCSGYCSYHYDKLRWKKDREKRIAYNKKFRARRPLYRTWDGIKQRCYNPNDTKYKYYGNRGIEVCKRWLGEDGFNNFLKDMGERPSPKHTIDRVDVNGDYEPSNCRWADTKTQSRNRTNVVVLHTGELLVEYLERKITNNINEKQIRNCYYRQGEKFMIKKFGI